MRIFTVGDEVMQTAHAVRQRLRALRGSEAHGYRQRHGKEMGANLGDIVQSIEVWLPVNLQLAFELLVAVIEAAGVAMSNCGDDGWEVECAF